MQITKELLSAIVKLTVTQKKSPHSNEYGDFENKCLTMTYSHMGRPHTTIGAEHFHF